MRRNTRRQAEAEEPVGCFTILLLIALVILALGIVRDADAAPECGEGRIEGGAWSICECFDDGPLSHFCIVFTTERR